MAEKERRTRKKKRERNELKPLLALALGLKSSEGFLLARHLTKQLEVNPFLRPPSILFFCESTSQKLKRFLTYRQCFYLVQAYVPLIRD